MSDYDLIVLGGGNAGLTAAQRVKTAGKNVALIDPTPVGGLCALRGCNPKKVLVRATEVLQLVRDAREHGIRTGDVTIDWNAVIDRKHAFTDPVSENTEKSLREAGIDHIKAPARFVSRDALKVEDPAAGRKARTLSFGHAVIATGSAPRRFSFPGAEDVSASDDILELRTVPQRLVVIGTGAVAFEFSHVFARLGSRVHMLMRGREALKRSDPGLVSRLLAHSRALGITLHENVEVEAVERSGDAFEVRLSNGGSVGADFVLNAAGRPPQLDGLALDAADVEHSENGVKVDDYLRSVSNSKVFAAGDAHGRMALSPIASYEGRVVAENVLNGDAIRADYSAIPAAVFTVPPLAGVGMTEDEARGKGLDIDVVTEDMAEWTVFRIAAEKPSHGKVITEKASGRIVGAHLFGPGADDAIHVFAMAMRYGISRRQLADMIYVYPTYGSAFGHLAAASGRG